MADMKRYLTEFKKCIQKEIPYCVSACPFHIDMLEFIEKVKRGGFKSAFKTYRNAVGFPQIVHALCPEPCKAVCPGRETEGAVELKRLEKACLDLAGNTAPTEYNLPLKKKKVAVIGAGISGLACALRLCMKKYQVVIYERENRIGGQLWELLPEMDFMADIEQQFIHEQYTLNLNQEITSPEDLKEQAFDAVFVATGKGGYDFGLLSAVAENGDPFCTEIENTGWFAGGSLIGDEPIVALANGLFMGTTIDNYLKTGNLLNPKNQQETMVCLDVSKKVSGIPVTPADGAAYTEEEAKKEAARCIECQCDACRIYCDLTSFYNKWPLRIKDEIVSTTLPGSSEVKATPAKRLLSTCSQCGLCKETCPEDIDLGSLILEGRKSMHQQKKAPWVFHDFWLKDMDFSNGEEAALCKLPLGVTACEYAFFPGCQLGASEPELVEKAYQALRNKKADLGLLLQCCGVPAEWSGDEEKHSAELKIIVERWKSLGEPKLILACPTCEKKFKTYLPEIPVISLYEIWQQWDLAIEGTNSQSFKDQNYSIFDPCAAREEEEMQQAVRNLAKEAGYHLEPLAENGRYAKCCSYGGQGAIANPQYAEYVAKRRVEESENPYISYCINCRDVFRDQGKESKHILEILLAHTAEKEGENALPTVTERRENRVYLKRSLLKNYWGETMETKKTEHVVALIIGSEMKRKLDQERIFEEDVISIVEFCERTGRKVFDAEKETFSGYREIGFMTCWVEYQPAKEKLEGKDTFELVNAYAHRMKIELEAVWNGRKTEVDL